MRLIGPVMADVCGTKVRWIHSSTADNKAMAAQQLAGCVLSCMTNSPLSSRLFSCVVSPKHVRMRLSASVLDGCSGAQCCCCRPSLASAASFNRRSRLRRAHANKDDGTESTPESRSQSLESSPGPPTSCGVPCSTSSPGCGPGCRS